MPKHYNPNQPRVPKGSGDSSGEWAAARDKHYDKIREAWKKAHTATPITSMGAHAYPRAIFQAVKKEFGKAGYKFTGTQLQRALFSDRMRTGMDAWDYLSELKAGKKPAGQRANVYNAARAAAVAKIKTDLGD